MNFSLACHAFNAVLATALAIATPQGAYAITTMCSTDPMVYTMTNSMLSLSSNIGTMADRILVTEDKIGQMADRIVTTENLLASTLVQIQGSGAAGGKPGVLLLAPATGDQVSRVTAPSIMLSDNATSYVLYVSATGNFNDSGVMPLLVTPQTPLQEVWPQAAQAISGNTVYIAVRSVIGQSNLSELSNGVRLGLQ
ncbi:MAG: hypothetical protein PHR30_17220 [Gallionellaceae bacterium]|nr:hypothetical protein [Gallionellaceae bacterium]MDD5367079.1 hypothetical protein [Gallionellaceae bacterium]